VALAAEIRGAEGSGKVVILVGGVQRGNQVCEGAPS
jgi:hypothetical protein